MTRPLDDVGEFCGPPNDDEADPTGEFCAPIADAPNCPECDMPLARFAGPGRASGWTCVRCDEQSEPEDPSAAPQAATPELPATSAPNALGKLRARQDVARDELSRRLGIADADTATLESTALRLLKIGDVERYVSALGCRLDVVAVHIDGLATWLTDEEAA